MKQAMTITKKTFLIFGLLLLGSLAFGQNNAPVTVDDYYTVLMNTLISENVLNNDTDPDGDNLIINTTPIINPNHGVFTSTPNGLFTYIPNVNYIGQDTFQYMICDDGTPTLCDTAMVYLNIIDSTDFISNVTSTPISSCYSTNGTITVEVHSFFDTLNLEYSIDSGLTWQANNGYFTNLNRGNYDIAVREIGTNHITYYDNNSVSVGGPQPPVISSVSITNPATCGSNNGTIVIYSGTSGYLNYSSYSYSIDGGSTWQDNYWGGTYPNTNHHFTNLPPGTYQIRVRTSPYSTCMASYPDVTLTAQSGGATISNVATTNPTTSTSLNGTITIHASNGTTPLIYSINGWQWQSDSVFTGLQCGTYPIYVKNADYSCQVYYGDITLNCPLELVNVQTNLYCANSTSDISITTQFGSGANFYSIDSGLTWQSNSLFANLVAGTYNVVATDGIDTLTYANNPVTVINATAPVLNNVSSTNPTNCGWNDGSITIHATGTSIEYSIDGGNNWQLSDTFNNVASGTYLIAIRNANGTCQVDANNPIILTAPNAPSITNVSITNPTDCSVADGTITITAIGGSGSLEYSIDGGINWQASNTFIGLSDGYYYQIRVKNIDGTCNVTYPNVTLTAPNPPTITNVLSTNISNCGGYDGSITIFATGGQTALNYSIDGGTTWTQSNTFTGLQAGTYQIRVRNVNGTCVVSAANVVITAPTTLLINNVTTTNPSNCGVNDGTITINATGNTNLQYSIDGGLTYLPSPNFIGLAAGNYYIIVRNANGTCETLYANNPVILTAPNAPTITNVVTTAPTDCGVTDGTITITATGGSAPLEYSIDNGLTWQNSNIFSGLSGGLYIIYVRNNGGNCPVFYTNVILNAPIAPVINNVTTTNPSNCGVNDGTITITATGLNLEYSISAGINWQSSNIFTGLSAGTYNIAVRNSDGTCEVYYTANPIILTAPIPPTITNVGFTTPSICNGNDGTITINSSSSTVKYSIDSGSTWYANNGQFTYVGVGNYNVFIKNIDGTCPVPYINNPVIITTPNPPSIDSIIKKDPLTCGTSDGRIIVNSNSTGVFEYTINFGVTWQTSDTFSNLGCGFYHVGIRDTSGLCTSPYQIIALTHTLEIFNVIVIDETCNGNDNEITINSWGGYINQYSVDSGLTWQSSNSFQNLTGGVYNILVKDTYGYTVAYVNNPVLVNTSMPPTVTNVNVIHPTSCAASNGSIEISANSPLGVEYSVGNNSGATPWSSITFYPNRQCITYDIRVRNGDGTCPIIHSLVTLQSPLAISNVNITNKICGQGNGKIKINAIDGTVLFSYFYSIDSGTTWQTVDSFTNLTPGNYHVLVTDGNDTLAYANNPIVINEMGTPTINAMYGGDFVFVNSIAATNLEYSLDCGATWQNNNFFNGISGTTFCSGVRYNDGSCPLFSTDTFINTVPIAINDSISFPKLNVKTFNILTNDVDAEGNHLYVKNTPQTINLGSASITIDSLGNVTVPTANFNFGTYNFDYIVCESYNPTHCDTASVAFTIYPPSHHIFDTIAIGATAQICIPNNLNGTSVSLTNVCGTIPNVVIDSVVGECLYLYADNYGDATTCFVRCDNLGDCDTTFLHFTVQDGVWPGDADDNTIVNNFDLLNVGLGYGTSGTARDSVTNLWNGYITPLWNVATPISNVDYRHLDCNGDGLINSDDTLAILQNYGFSYQRNGGGNFGTPLAVGTDTSYVLPHFTLPINLGELNNPAADVYGGAFSILYDTTFIKKDSVFITFNNSWVGTNNVDMISLHKNFGDNQQIDVAFTRINGTNVTGFGEIGQLNFTIKDDILQRGMTLDSVIFDFYIINTKFISADEQEVDVAAGNTSWVVKGSGVSTQFVTNLGQWINIFPNPATNYVQIQSPKLVIENIIITDGIGKTVLQNTPTDKRNIQLNVGELPQGVYHIQLQTEKGTVVKQLVILE